MARQKGVLQFTGTLGELTFYYHKTYGYIARKKTGVSRERMRNDPAFARSRENAVEFGRAAKAAKHFRHLLLNALQYTADPMMANRFTQAMVKVVKADAHHARGQRAITRDNLALLKGFEFNAGTPLGKSFAVPFHTALDPAATELAITFNGPADHTTICAPQPATHFRLISKVVVSALDLSSGMRCSTSQADQLISLSELPVSLPPLVHPIKKDDGSAALGVLGIVFYQQAGAELAVLHDRNYNAMQLIEVYGSRQE